MASLKSQDSIVAVNSLRHNNGVMWGLMRVKAAVKIKLKTFLYNI